MPFADSRFFLPASTRPQIGVSACLTGEPVRYDGGHKYQPLINTFINQYADLLPICPEAGAGLGIPRPPIRQLQRDGRIVVETVAGQEDVSEQLLHFAQQTAHQLAGKLTAFIVKSRSPSCALGSAALYDTQLVVRDTIDGRFTAALRAQWPDCYFVDEERLNNRQQCLDLLLRCRLLGELKQLSDREKNLLTAHYRQYFPSLADHNDWQQRLLDNNRNLLDTLLPTQA